MVTCRFRAGCTYTHPGAGEDIFPCRDRHAHRAGTPGLTPHRDTHGYQCTDLTLAEEMQLPQPLRHTQKPRDIMAGTHLDLFSS